MLSEILNIKPGLTSIIGSGGKTTLMYKLAKELSASEKVIICTFTKIYKPEHIITPIDPSEEDIKNALSTNSCICVGKLSTDEKLTMPDISVEILLKYANYVISEADGSRGLPLKAHRDYEPVIHRKPVNTIQVLGISGINKKIKDACHRPETYAETAGASITDEVTPKMAAYVVKKEGLCDVLIINQVENDDNMKDAEKIADYLDIPVYAGEIMKGDLICLQS